MDGGSAALYTKQENELFIMNCDIDGASAYMRLCEIVHLCGWCHVIIMNHVVQLYVNNISACAYFRRHGEPGGDGGEDKVNKSSFGTSAHAGR